MSKNKNKRIIEGEVLNTDLLRSMEFHSFKSKTYESSLHITLLKSIVDENKFVVYEKKILQTMEIHKYLSFKNEDIAKNFYSGLLLKYFNDVELVEL